MRDHDLGAVVVGTGFGCLTHTRALRAAGFAVRALVGRDPLRTAERARRFEVPNAYTSLAEALALGGVDAVVVATPPHAHAPIVLEAIAAGKHVLCEKPFARDAAEHGRLPRLRVRDRGVALGQREPALLRRNGGRVGSAVCHQQISGVKPDARYLR